MFDLNDNEETDLRFTDKLGHPNPNQLHFPFIKLIFERRKNEIMKVIICNNSKKTEIIIKEQVLSKGHFLSISKDIKSFNFFQSCSYYYTYINK